MTKDNPGFDWDLLMRFGLGALGLGPREFWAMTPREFDAAVKGRMGVFEDASPLDRSAFAELSSRFPDRRAP
ncbi:phage tail assembly chaperone [Pikeienuella sp. HZG-20]|uniref:phage tail assembly chaperone n=1 Tax=Paludibacillus litoralis TaxID=3133267 RepID=UPI0030EDBF21